MLTSQIVNLLNVQNPEWTQQKLVDLLGFYVEMVTVTDSQDAIYFDPTTGDLPWLPTTKEIFQYNLPSEFYKVRSIVIAAINTNGLNYASPNNPYFGNNPTNQFVNPKASIYLGSMEYISVPVVLQPGFGGNPATVLFRFDPNNTTQTYQIYGYSNAYNSIVSINSVIPIEAKFHLSVVIPCLQLMIDALDNGNFVDVIPQVMQLSQQIMIQKYYNANDDVNVEPFDL